MLTYHFPSQNILSFCTKYRYRRYQLGYYLVSDRKGNQWYCISLITTCLTTVILCFYHLFHVSVSYLATQGFPIEYPPSQHCVWVLTAPEPDHKIIVTFNSHFYLEGKDCKHDYVEVYDGGDELSPLFGRYCGEVAPSPIMTSGNQVLIKFISDDEVQEAGFSVVYELFKPGESTCKYTNVLQIQKTSSNTHKHTCCKGKAFLSLSMNLVGTHLLFNASQPGSSPFTVPRKHIHCVASICSTCQIDDVFLSLRFVYLHAFLFKKF
uniref:CUB domain-containing protein n=1 Tax=Seriola lalandi dorsalis TaxID=1841481 RepID=A0A3B4WAU5_SERLL